MSSGSNAKPSVPWKYQDKWSQLQHNRPIGVVVLFVGVESPTDQTHQLLQYEAGLACRVEFDGKWLRFSLYEGSADVTNDHVWTSEISQYSLKINIMQYTVPYITSQSFTLLVVVVYSRPKRPENV